MCIVIALIVPILAALLTWSCRWAYGVCLWEIFSFGKCKNLSFCFNPWLSCCCIFNAVLYLNFLSAWYSVLLRYSYVAAILFPCIQLLKPSLPTCMNFNYFLHACNLMTSCMQVICRTVSSATLSYCPGWWQATGWTVLRDAQKICTQCV